VASVPADVLAEFQAGNAQALIDWYNAGADGAIDWCSPGDFEDCVNIASDHLDNPEGFCNERHQDACGGPPGSEGSSIRKDATMPLTRRQILANFANAAKAAFEPYPWDDCIADQLNAGHSQDSAEKICGTIKAQNSAVADMIRLAVTTPTDATPVDVSPRTSGATATGGNGEPFDPLPYHADADENVECPNCHKMNDQDASFCDQCGTKLVGNPDVMIEVAGDGTTAPSAAASTMPRTFADAPPAAAPEPEPPDVKVDAALKAIDDAIAAAEDAERADMAEDGETTSKILDGLDVLKQGMLDVHSSQQSDETAEAGEADEDESKGGPLTTNGNGSDGKTAAALADVGNVPGNAEGVAGDADDSGPGPGDIEAAAQCQNPNCQHMGGVHENTTTGENTGACTTPGCTCPGMVPPDDAQLTNDNDTAQGAGNNGNGGADAEEEDSSAIDGGMPSGGRAVGGGGRTGQSVQGQRGQAFQEGAMPAEGEAAPATTPAPQSGDNLPPPNPEPQSTLQGPEFTIPVGVIEGMATGDGRGIADGALDWLDPPRPLMGLFTSTHDPNGMDSNAPAEWIGVVEAITRNPGDNGVITATGHLLTTEEGLNAAAIIEQMGRCPVSADVVGRADRPIETTSVLDDILLPVIDLPPGDVALQGPEPDGDEEAPEAIPGVMETLTQGTIAGFTVVPTAAFEDCFIVLGDGSDQPPVTQLVNRAPTSAPAAPDEGTTNGAAPPTAPPPGPIVTASMGYVLHDINDCEPCATAKPVLASGGPIAPPRSWFSDPAFGKGGDDPRLRECIDDRTGRMSGKFACPPTITEDGEVFMHLAPWGVCHTSPQYKGRCVLAPHNSSGYAYWYQGAQILTAEGEMVDVGAITIGTGHAPLRAGMGETLAHYDNTGTAVAYGQVGEDEHGIWFHGSLSVDATPEQVYKLRASIPSGDWRPRGNREELCACLMVNRGGFPQARAHSVNGRKTALIAAGPAFIEDAVIEPTVPLTIEQRLARLESSTSPLLPMAHDAIVKRFEALRS
jgi:hypothetical protein